MQISTKSDKHYVYFHYNNRKDATTRKLVYRGIKLVMVRRKSLQRRAQNQKKILAYHNGSLNCEQVSVLWGGPMLRACCHEHIHAKKTFFQQIAL